LPGILRLPGARCEGGPPASGGAAEVSRPNVISAIGWSAKLEKVRVFQERFPRRNQVRRAVGGRYCPPLREVAFDFGATFDPRFGKINQMNRAADGIVRCFV
jgi:hypothetical protein